MAYAVRFIIGGYFGVATITMLFFALSNFANIENPYTRKKKPEHPNTIILNGAYGVLKVTFISIFWMPMLIIFIVHSLYDWYSTTRNEYLEFHGIDKPKGG